MNSIYMGSIFKKISKEQREIGTSESNKAAQVLDLFGRGHNNKMSKHLDRKLKALYPRGYKG
tara:strand:- start:1037 stop:1222 length:186 start_codon:yes stop_codon:yes gene_type:complete